MKKLKIVFNDNSQIIYTLKNRVDHMQYFNRHSKHQMKNAVLQKYPLKDNQPVLLI